MRIWNTFNTSWWSKNCSFKKMIKFSDKRNWNVSKFDNHNLYYYGNLDIVEKIIKELIKKNKIDRLFL